MGLLASTGKLPSLFFENKVHPKCRSREGRREINTWSKAWTLGREAQWRLQAPSSAKTLPSVNTTEAEETILTEGICSRKELQTTPPSSGQRAEPEMPARPWTLGPGTSRGGRAQGCSRTVPSKGPFVLPWWGRRGLTVAVSPGAASHWPKVPAVTCHQPLRLPAGAGGWRLQIQVLVTHAGAGIPALEMQCLCDLDVLLSEPQLPSLWDRDS